ASDSTPSAPPLKPATTDSQSSAHSDGPRIVEKTAAVGARSPVEPKGSIRNSIGMTFTLIPAGGFLMGEPPGEGRDDEHPQHRVRITRPFYMGIHEVTRGQFRRFVQVTGYRTEAEKGGSGSMGWNETRKDFEFNPRYTWENPGFDQTDEHPVVNVSGND